MFSKRGNKMFSAHGSSKRESPLEGFKLQSRALVLVCFSQPRKPQSTYWFLFFSNKKKNEATRLFKHCTQFHEIFCYNHAFMFYPHNPHNNPLSQWYTAWDIYVCVPWTTICVSLLGKKMCKLRLNAQNTGRVLKIAYLMLTLWSSSYPCPGYLDFSAR